ncbi:glycosyltransferase family 39 protein [Candidatus Roizmanbacteria bacterium]|nr:glycosyltransferase family 39 protein [Candidatus Roizmanbacteria bacterium]
MFDIFKIFNFLKKNLSRKDLLIIILIIGLFFLTRLINLDKFPIFSDEGIYIHWAKVAWHDASWRFISLTDGKQPLQTWGTIPFLKLFPDNALLAGRLFGVLGGFLSLVGFFSLTFYLFGKRASQLGSFLYVFTPYFLFYERMALVDSWVNAGFIWIFLFLIYLVREKLLSTSLILGLLGGFFLLAKSSVRIFLMLGIISPILVFQKNLRKFFKESVNYYFLLALSITIALVIYNIQRLSPFFHYVDQKNLTFVMSFDEFFKTPFQYFWNNLRYTPLYIFWEMGFVLGLIGLSGLIKLIKKDIKLGFYFLLWILLPFTAIVFFTKVLFPRYLIFFASILLILAAYYLSDKTKKFLFVLIFLSVVFFDFTILFGYKNIPFPAVDRGQYIEGWPAGWGIKETMEFARKKSKDKPVVIIAEGNFGMAYDVLDVYLKPTDKITLKGYWPLNEKQLYENQPLLKDSYVYVFFSHRDEFPEFWPMKLVKRIEKPGYQSDFHLFELTTDK